jgi:hypothetical protein
LQSDGYHLYARTGGWDLLLEHIFNMTARRCCCCSRAAALAVLVLSHRQADAFAPPAAAGARRAGSRAKAPLYGQPQAGDVFQADKLTEGMRYVQLGSSDLVISQVCLGTMTWGSQVRDVDVAN